MSVTQWIIFLLLNLYFIKLQAIGYGEQTSSSRESQGYKSETLQPNPEYGNGKPQSPNPPAPGYGQHTQSSGQQHTTGFLGLKAFKYTKSKEEYQRYAPVPDNNKPAYGPPLGFNPAGQQAQQQPLPYPPQSYSSTSGQSALYYPQVQTSLYNPAPTPGYATTTTQEPPKYYTAEKVNPPYVTPKEEITSSKKTENVGYGNTQPQYPSETTMLKHLYFTTSTATPKHLYFTTPTHLYFTTSTNQAAFLPSRIYEVSPAGYAATTVATEPKSPSYVKPNEPQSPSYPAPTPLKPNEPQSSSYPVPRPLKPYEPQSPGYPAAWPTFGSERVGNYNELTTQPIAPLYQTPGQPIKVLASSDLKYEVKESDSLSTPFHPELGYPFYGDGKFWYFKIPSNQLRPSSSPYQLPVAPHAQETSERSPYKRPSSFQLKFYK